MKKKGILLNVIISIAKALPVAIVVGIAAALIAYAVFATLLPSGYLSQSCIMPVNQGDSGLEIVSTEAFYSHVTEAFAEKGGELSSQALKSTLKTTVNADGSITFGARTANALTSYYMVQTAVESAEYFYSVQGGGITVLSAPSVPTTLSQDSLLPYAIFFGILAVALTLIWGLCRGLTLGKVLSEKEFLRVADLPVVGVLSTSKELKLEIADEIQEEEERV